MAVQFANETSRTNSSAEKEDNIEDEGRTIHRARRNVCFSVVTRQLHMFQVFDINKDILVSIERQNTDVYK